MCSIFRSSVVYVVRAQSKRSDRLLLPDLESQVHRCTVHTSDTTHNLTSSFALPKNHMELPPTRDLAIAAGAVLHAAFAHARK